VFRHADEIFGIGRELIETLQLSVGIANAVPKLIACRLLRPTTHLAEPVLLMCREDNPEQLVSQLALHALDVVIADAPAPPHVRVKVFNHLLGESDTAFFSPIAQAARLRKGFPRSLADSPMVLPAHTTAGRRGLDAWFEKVGVRPRIVAEFEDSALMKVFAQDIGAVCPAPVVIQDDVCRVYASVPSA